MWTSTAATDSVLSNNYTTIGIALQQIKVEIYKMKGKLEDYCTHTNRAHHLDVIIITRQLFSIKLTKTTLTIENLEL